MSTAPPRVCATPGKTAQNHAALKIRADLHPGGVGVGGVWPQWSVW